MVIEIREHRESGAFLRLKVYWSLGSSHTENNNGSEGEAPRVDEGGHSDVQGAGARKNQDDGDCA